MGDDEGVAVHPFGEADEDGMVGESEAAWDLRRSLARAVRAGGSVLVLGPSGAGKERAAAALHRLARRKGSLVAVNAAAVPEGVLEAELFGNIGNYPNAGTPERKGFIGEAEGGTLFIDEIACLSAGGQAALLRLLQEHRYSRLGEAATRKADVFVVAATNEDPALLRFDFRMRFDHVVELPPLASRPEDIVLIARDFVLGLARTRPALAARFVVDAQHRREVDWTPAMVHAMTSAPWPGNVRQLQSFLRAAMAAQKERPLHPPADMRPWGVTPEATLPSPDDDRSEAARVQAALAQCRWNVSKATELLGLPSRREMYRLMDRAGVSRRS
jgi:two-component system nitrogen regulation response regulator GlnG/two-component system response regulator HydG